MSKPAGKFIVFEGGEGSGKDTQIEILKNRLSADKTIYTREPGGTETAEKIRQLLLNEDVSMSPKTELALFCGARADHVEKIIKPSLEAGKIVISNRFDLSTFAYQIYGREQHEYAGFLTQMNDYVMVECKPDAYIYVQLDVEEGLRRVSRRSEDDNRLDKESLDFHRRVMEGYNKLAAERDNCFIVDGSQTIEEVAEDVWKVIESLKG
jgi:dTMP kinase